MSNEKKVSSTGEVHNIINYARQLDDVINTLYEVNMDRLAKKLVSLQWGIIQAANFVGEEITNDLDRNLQHNTNMAGGLLMAFMKMGDLQDQGDKTKGEQA
jgi:hypothetical protein